MIAEILSRWMPVPVGTIAYDIDALIVFIFYIITPWFLVAEALLFFFIWRYRRKAGQKASAESGNTWSALAYVLIPAVLVFGFDMWIDAEGGKVWHKVKETIPASGQLVKVQGAQFFWTFTHAGPDQELNTADDLTVDNHLHVLVDIPVIFELESTDVIHSFFIPNLRLKQDLVPGRRIKGWFEADKPGVYEIACAELCGLGHTRMRGWLHVDTPEDYQVWLKQMNQEKTGDSFWQ